MEQFIVSARKYRPATFETVVGQSHITSTLKNAITRGQLAHAYLFCGPRGVGKTTCARIFAKTINCLTPNGSEPCGVCESCVGFESGRSMNIHELDAASNNSVEDIRSLIDQVRIIPQVGRYALFIIDEVHMLSTAAFNAFLKTLEEPPAHAIFILATTERHKILPTILSRCQCYDFNRIRVEDGAEYLRYIANKEGVTIDDESLNLIAQKADGGMRDALSMFDKAVSFGGNTLDFKTVAQTLGVVDYDTYFTLADQLLDGDYPSALMTFDRVLGSGFGASSFLTGFARHMRDLLVAHDETTLRLMELTGSLVERYRVQAARCSVEFLFGSILVLTTADGDLRRSSNQRLLVELGLMKIAGLGQKKNVDSGYLSVDPSLKDVTLVTTPVEVAAVEPAVVLPSVATEPAPTPTNKTTIVEKAPAEETPTESANEVAVTTKDAPTSRKSPLFDLQGALHTKKSVLEESEGDDVVARREDPDAESKLSKSHLKIVEYISSTRPRFKPYFESMRIVGSVIEVEVSSDVLEMEVRRQETEIMTHIAELSGVDGYISLRVVVNETVQAKRPIKLEDRIAHFTELNPDIVGLTEALDLQIDS